MVDYIRHAHHTLNDFPSFFCNQDVLCFKAVQNYTGSASVNILLESMTFEGDSESLRSALTHEKS